MKKIALIVALCSMLVPSLKAQEVTYVEDPAQGYLFNKFKDNWFVQGEIGGNVLLGPNDSKVESFGDRIGYAFQLSVGKWFSPIIGARLGADAYLAKGAALGLGNDLGLRPDLDKAENAITQNAWNFGPTGDVLINLTNWWCGYKPGRVYNAIFYAGASVNFVSTKDVKEGGWSFENGDSHNLSLRVCLLNKFAVSKHVDILLDIRGDLVQEHYDTNNTKNGLLTALVGVGYNFGKTEWNAPITAVCPTWKYTDAEGDALAARLQAAEAKIADLEKQLRDCLNRKPEVVEAKEEGPLATIYYPIGKSTITGVNTKIVNAVANLMKESNDNYILTGWADNYTGTDKINAKLRKDRVNGVKKALVRKGVEEGRLDAQINDGNLTNFGAKSASLDRAVTIQVAK